MSSEPATVEVRGPASTWLLLIEQNEFLARALERYLGRCFARVTVVCSITEALASSDILPTHLVCGDEYRPRGESGREAESGDDELSALLAAHPAISAVVCTTSGETSPRHLKHTSVEKPQSPAAILEALGVDVPPSRRSPLPTLISQKETMTMKNSVKIHDLKTLKTRLGSTRNTKQGTTKAQGFAVG